MVRNRGSFARNAATTFTGVVITIAAQLLLTPLITRIYGPQAYGVYGLFMAISTNVALLATASYPMAFVLPANEHRFRDLFKGTGLLLLATTALAFLLLPFREAVYTIFPGWAIMGKFALLLPLAVLLQGLHAMFGQACVRHKAFLVTAQFNAGFNVGVRLFNVIVGWATGGILHGLIMGELLVRGAAMGVFIRPLRRFGLGATLGTSGFTRALAVLRHYARYPKYVLPTRWLALLFGQLPIFFLAEAGAPISLVQYAMAGALLLIPLRLLGYSLNSVFMQKAAETMRTDRTRLPLITGRLFDRLLLLGVAPFAVQIVFGDVIFGLLLGSEWTGAGVFSAMLGLYFFFRLLAEPMAPLFAILVRDKRLFGFHLANTLLGAAALWVGMRLMGNVHLGILLFGISGGIMHAYLAGRILVLAGVPWLPRITRALALLALACIVLLMLRKVMLGDFLALP